MIQRSTLCPEGHALALKKDIFSGIHVTVFDESTFGADMSPNAQAFRNDCLAPKAHLRSEVRSDLYHPPASIFSFVGQDENELTPACIVNAFGEMTISSHPADIQVFNGNEAISIGVNLGRLEEKVTALLGDFKVSLGHVLGGFPPAAASLDATGENALFAPKRLLALAVIARVLNRSTFRVGQEDLETNIQTDGGPILYGFNGRHFTDDERIPMAVSSQDNVNRFWETFEWPMEFDLDEFSELSGYMKMLPIGIQPDIFALAILPEVNGVPLIGVLEARETGTGVSFFSFQVSAKGLVKSVRERLYCRSRHVLATAFECLVKVVTKLKFSGLFILGLRLFQHLVVKMTRLREALDEQPVLFLVGVKAIFKGFHRKLMYQISKCLSSAIHLKETRKCHGSTPSSTTTPKGGGL